ncbi:MAG: hypothetical protein EXS67_00980 [Candidatus Margulisbacteria bacterium]|nr:hypothetical protein [Candidatus Margulisiibacteriota bacterium]
MQSSSIYLNGNNSGSEIYHNRDRRATYIQNRQGADIIFLSSTKHRSGELVRIKDAGNVGVGTTSPTSKLSIVDVSNKQDVSLEMVGGWNRETFGVARISVGKASLGGYSGIIKFQPQYYDGTRYGFRDVMVAPTQKLELVGTIIVYFDPKTLV